MVIAMRLYLLPISTRRTLLYCKQLTAGASAKPSLLDRCTDKAASLWARWEEKDAGMQRKIVDWGNEALKKIPYEEWGLKSVPPLSARRRSRELRRGEVPVEVVFPSTVIREGHVSEVLRKLGTEREALHKSRIMYCFVGMPITLPLVLIPV